MNKDVNLSEKVKILMDIIPDWESIDLGDETRKEKIKIHHDDNNVQNDSFDDKRIKALTDREAWEELKRIKERRSSIIKYSPDRTKILYADGSIEEEELVINSTVTEIRPEVFWRRKIEIDGNGNMNPHYMYFQHKFKKVSIPSSVKFIGENAFRACKNLEEVYFEERKTEINIYEGAFSLCENLKRINFPPTTIFYNNHNKKSDAILYKTDVEQIDVYDTFRFGANEIIRSDSYGQNMNIIVNPYTQPKREKLIISFHGCRILAHMFSNFPIDNFSNWKNFDQIQEVEDDAFFVDELEDQSRFIPKNEDGDVVNIIPPNVRKVGKNAYRNRELPANIKLPKTLEEIGEGAFINTKIKLISCTSWQAKVLRANHAIDDDVEIQIDDESLLKQETLEKWIAVNPRMNNIVITCDDINVKDKRVVAIRLECDDPNMIASISKINGNDIHINILSVAEQSVEVEIKIFITYCE